MPTQHATTQKDLTSAHVIRGTVVMDLHAMVRRANHEYETQTTIKLVVAKS